METHLEQYRGPYLKRNGEGYLDMVNELSAPPARPLTDTEKIEARAFETELFEHEVQPGVTIEDIARGYKDEDIIAPQVFAEAFLQNRVDTSGLPEDVEIPDFTTHEQVYRWFASRVNDKKVSEDKLLAMAQGSFAFYKETSADCLLNRHRIPSEITDYQAIVLDPDQAIELANQTMHARHYLLDERKKYTESDEGENIDGAKRAYVDIYLAKVNSLIAISVPQMGYVIEQAVLSGDSELINRALAVTPLGFRNALQHEENEARLMTRLDYMRNGMGLQEGIDQKVKASAISEELLKIADSEDQQTVEAQCTPEQIEALKRFPVDPERARQGIENILRRAGKLSAEDHSTWSPKRTTRASDGLAQVVLNPSKKSVSVDPVSGAFKCSPEDRSIFDILSVYCGHELKHIDQMFADDALSENFKLASVKGKRVTMLREAGANRVQRLFEIWFAGKSKPVALTYAKALQEIGNGHGLAGAAKAFFDEKLRIMPTFNRAKAASDAADRVVRLVRAGGISSAALSYGEEGVMIHELQDAPEAVQARATAITGLDLVDQVRLHRYDLIDIPEPEEIDWTALALEEFQPEIDAALATVAA